MGIGKAFNPPTFDNKKVTAGNAMRALTVCLKKLFGESFVKEAPVQVVADVEEDEEVEGAETFEYSEHPVEFGEECRTHLGDASNPQTWREIKISILELFDSHQGVTRVHIVTSPPWGVLTGQNKDGQADAPLTRKQIGEVKDCVKNELCSLNESNRERREQTDNISIL